MATLADLLGSVNTSNMNAGNLNAAPVAYQKPRGFWDTVGKIGDVLAAFGGQKGLYGDFLKQKEDAYNQSMKQQQFQNVFSNFIQNPNDPNAFAQAASMAPAETLKFREALMPQPQAQGTQPREILIANMLADPKVSPEVKAKLEALVAPKPARERLVATERGYLPESQAQGLMPYRAPERASGGGSQGGNTPTTMFERRAEAIRKQFGEDAYAQFIATGKFTPPGGGTPTETGALIKEAKSLLPSATSGGLQAAAATVQGVAGIGTRAMAADERLNVIGARLVATVPRFEGPQSDKDTALYRQSAADVANPAKPRNVRLAALDTLEKLQQRAVTSRRVNAPPPAGNFVVLRRRPAGGQ